MMSAGGTRLSIRTTAAWPGAAQAWYRAVTLAERLEGRAPGTLGRADDPREGLDPAEASRLQYRLSSWISQSPFDDPAILHSRLGLDGLTERELGRLLAERPDHIRQRLAAIPDWMATIEAALSSTPTCAFHALLPDRLQRTPTTGFLDVAAPFIDLALEDLHTRAAGLARRLERCPFDPDAVASMFIPDLARALLRIVSRTMVLELNVARVEGTLEGATAEARFASFIRQLHDPARLRAIFEEYPVLARLIAEETRRWADASLELVERVSHDFGALERAFANGRPLGPLVGVSGRLADPHDGGRSVVIARFGSGTRVVYKPKSLAVDAHFQALVTWLNIEGFTPGLRPLTILDRGPYGWAEYVSPAECRTPDDVTRFYERTGAGLALLYVLDATDLHAGNVIASGEHPLFIDLEALFHPRRSAPVDEATATADTRAARSVRYSVLRIGLLPERVWGNDEHEGVVISGMGGPEGQLTPHGVADWEASGTDTMRLVRRRKAIAADLNRPVLEGQALDPLEHRDAILRGFRSAYALLAARKDALVAPGGPLERFRHDAVSVFLRSSRTYRRLLRESYHPDVLRDALDRDRLFDRLWVEVPGREDLATFIRSERADLWNGDIPCFKSRPESRDLWFGEGESLPEFFPEPSLSSRRRLVQQMDDEDCARQAWYIEASLASLAEPPRAGSTAPEESDASPTRDALLAEAIAIGHRLDQLAVRGPNTASWIGLQREGRRAWSIERAGLDLDAGVPGIALCLAYLGAVVGHDRATALADAALNTVREQIAERGSSWTALGAFDGLGSLIYAYAHLAAVWRRDDLAREATAMADRLPALVPADDRFDVYAGAAGCILALRSLHACVPSDVVTGIAVQCGDHLLGSACATDGGLAWPGLSDDPTRDRWLHGVTGIARALDALHEWTGLDRFQAGALKAVDRAPDTPGDTGTMAPTRLDGIRRHAWHCRTPLGVETPGLTAGLAGIGLGVLRAARPDVVPSVLSLDPPLIAWRAHVR